MRSPTAKNSGDSLITYNAQDGKQPGDPVKAMGAVVDVEGCLCGAAVAIGAREGRME